MFEYLIGNKQAMRIVGHLIEQSPNSYSKTEIIMQLKMGRNTLYKAFDILEAYSLIKPMSSAANCRYYCINKESPIIKSLLKINHEMMKMSGGHDSNLQ